MKQIDPDYVNKQERLYIMKEYPPLTLTSIMPFGKYKGDTIEDILDDDPQYIGWCTENIEIFLLDDEAFDYLNEELKDL